MPWSKALRALHEKIELEAGDGLDGAAEFAQELLDLLDNDFAEVAAALASEG